MRIIKLIFQIFLFITFLTLLDSRKKNKKETIEEEDYDFEDQIEKNKKIKEYKVSQKENNHKIEKARERAKRVKESPNVQKIQKLNEQQFEDKINQISSEKVPQTDKIQTQNSNSMDDEHKLIEKYFINVLWGDIFPEKTENLYKFENLALRGILPCYKLKVAAQELGIDINQFNDMGVDKSKELVYPGVIQFKDQKTSSQYYQAFTACCHRQDVIEKIKKNNEEKIHHKNETILNNTEKSNHDEL